MKSKSTPQSPLWVKNAQTSSEAFEEKTTAISCPVCGAVAVQEKCKVICRSEICRGRVILNCSEF